MEKIIHKNTMAEMMLRARGDLKNKADEFYAAETIGLEKKAEMFISKILKRASLSAARGHSKLKFYLPRNKHYAEICINILYQAGYSVYYLGGFWSIFGYELVSIYW